MQRRDFITLVGGAAAAWPLAARAQQPDRVRRIGVLMGIANDAEGKARLAAFRETLQNLGWREGRDVTIDIRWGAGDGNRVRVYAAELVKSNPAVILVNSGVALAALKSLTRVIPIVFVQAGDPVSEGIITNLARPGGNITGFLNFEDATSGKWLELLKDIASRVVHVLVIVNPESPSQSARFRVIEAAAPSRGVQVERVAVHNAGDIDHAIDDFAHKPNGGLIVFPDFLTTVNRELIVSLADRHGLPAIYPYRYFVAAGGLASYGIDNLDLYRRAGSYVDRILKGAKPGDLPVQAPTKFELVINLKTAKRLGLDVPLHLQQLADEVIE